MQRRNHTAHTHIVLVESVSIRAMYEATDATYLGIFEGRGTARGGHFDKSASLEITSECRNESILDVELHGGGLESRASWLTVSRDGG